jgi:hypothetical protein
MAFTSLRVRNGNDSVPSSSTSTCHSEQRMEFCSILEYEYLSQRAAHGVFFDSPHGVESVLDMNRDTTSPGFDLMCRVEKFC